MAASGASYESGSFTGQALVCPKNQRHDFGALCQHYLIIIFYAIRGGLSAEEILGRTQGNIAFAVFYEIFVLACFVHAPIGLANILEETFSKGLLSKALSSILAALILVLGTTAVVGVYTGGAL